MNKKALFFLTMLVFSILYLVSILVDRAKLADLNI